MRAAELLHTRPGAGGAVESGLRPTSLGLRCLLGLIGVLLCSRLALWFVLFVNVSSLIRHVSHVVQC